MGNPRFCPETIMHTGKRKSQASQEYLLHFRKQSTYSIYSLDVQFSDVTHTHTQNHEFAFFMCTSLRETGYV